MPARHDSYACAFRPGDVVSLGPNGLPMTVESVDQSGNVRVKWVCHFTLYHGTFEPWRLILRHDRRRPERPNPYQRRPKPAA